jgi:hypothetical protein
MQLPATGCGICTPWRTVSRLVKRPLPSAGWKRLEKETEYIYASINRKFILYPFSAQIAVTQYAESRQFSL